MVAGDAQFPGVDQVVHVEQGIGLVGQDGADGHVGGRVDLTALGRQSVVAGEQLGILEAAAAVTEEIIVGGVPAEQARKDAVQVGQGGVGLHGGAARGGMFTVDKLDDQVPGRTAVGDPRRPLHGRPSIGGKRHDLRCHGKCLSPWSRMFQAAL